MSEQDRGRALRRRHMHERQAVIFGVLLAGLAVAALGAAAVYTGKLDLPVVGRGFSTAPATATVANAAGPCPPEGAAPVPYDQITVNVYNATSRVRLAAATAEALAERGFHVGTAQNGTPYSGVAQISFGPAGVAQAYTLAAHVEGATLLLVAKDPADPSVDLALGKEYGELKPIDTVLLDPAVPFIPPPGCTPLSEATPAAPPTPTAAPAG
ncbi:LytR C-terminal domain-containing protein [Cellulomonas sp. URHB0016]